MEKNQYSSDLHGGKKPPEMPKHTICMKAVEILLAATPPGSKVFLFGSRATGHADSDSDWDFLVVEPGKPNRMTEMARLSAILGEALIPADVIVMSHDAFEYWQDAPNSLPYAASREGVVYESVG